MRNEDKFKKPSVHTSPGFSSSDSTLLCHSHLLFLLSNPERPGRWEWSLGINAQSVFSASTSSSHISPVPAWVLHRVHFLLEKCSCSSVEFPMGYRVHICSGMEQCCSGICFETWREGPLPLAPSSPCCLQGWSSCIYFFLPAHFDGFEGYFALS